MPGIYRTTSTSAQSYQVEVQNEDGSFDRNVQIYIAPAGTTRKVLRATIVKNTKNPQEKVKVCLFHQRKTSSGIWDDIESVNLSTLKGGEGIKLDLNSSTTYKLFEELSYIYSLAQSGEYGSGIHDLIVGRAEEMVRVPASRAATIRQLIEAGFSEEVWMEIQTNNPDLADRLSKAKIQEDREVALEQFRQMLNEDRNEREWQIFFDTNQWIFGYGLQYIFLDSITGQPSLGGRSVFRQGEQVGDFLQRTGGDISFTVLVEIKKPNTQVVSDEENRSGSVRLSRDLIDATNQVQVNCHQWEISGSREDQNREILENNGIYTIKPKGILIIGHTNQLNNLRKRISFETYRSSLHQPEIITYDELLKRAEFIVGR